MTYTEKEYNDLYKYSLNIASKYVGYKDCAYDIAQNSLLSLISSKAEIKSPFSWIRTTVRREATRYLENEKKSLDIANKKVHDIPPSSAAYEDETDKIFDIDLMKVYRLLSKEDFAIFKKMKAVNFSSLKYSAKHKISLNTANSQKKRIKRNIQSSLLWENGWRSSDQILNYAQHNNIVRFIKQLLVSLSENRVADLKNYLEKVDKIEFQNLFKDIESCIEWYVIYMDNSYKLMLVFTPINPIPKVVELTIDFNHTNYLKVIEAKEKKPYIVINTTAEEVRKHKEKGKLTLSGDQIVSILTNKQTSI